MSLFRTNFQSASETIPLSCMQECLSVLWDEPFTMGNNIWRYFWFEVIDFDKDIIKGKPLFSEPGIWHKAIGGPGHFGNIYEIGYNEVWSIRGTREWNIENLYVSCSLKVSKGEKVGYFYDTLNFRARHLGKSFYGVSEISENKNAISLTEIPLKMLLSIDSSLEPHFDRDVPYGMLRNDDGEFDLLTEDYIGDKDIDVFPCDSILPGRPEKY